MKKNREQGNKKIKGDGGVKKNHTHTQFTNPCK